MVGAFEKSQKYLEIHTTDEMSRLLLRLRREHGKSQRQLGRALGLTLEQVVEMEKRYATIPFGAIFQQMLALYGVSLRISRQYEPPPGAYLHDALREYLPRVGEDMRAFYVRMEHAPLQSIFEELKNLKLRIWFKAEEYQPYMYKLFRVRTREGKSTTVSVDTRIVRKALWSLAGGREVAHLVRETSLTFDKTQHNESRSLHVRRCLLDAIAAADQLYEGQVRH